MLQLKSRYISPKINVTPFSKLNLGRKVNSGHQATVFNIKGFKSLVAKTNSFDPESLKWDLNPFTHQLLASENGSVVMEKVAGKPLFGNNWLMTDFPFVSFYKRHLRKNLTFPKEALLDYIKQIVNLRKNGYEVDYINPNNILYDKKKKKFNIVDLDKCDPMDSNTLDIRYFGPFWDDVRLLNIYDKANFISKIQIANMVKKMMEKVCEIAQNNGYKIKIDSEDEVYQSPSICFYNNQKSLLDKLLKQSGFRDAYLLRLDD